MDHFLLPKNPTPAEFKVPYVCKESYDGGDFLTYPARKGKPWLASRWSNRRQALANPVFRDCARRQTVQDQESFYQTWLFFGLLGATLGEQYDAADYIYRDEDCTYVTTQRLVQTLQKVFHIGIVAWGNSKPEKETKQEQYKTFARYLQLVSAALELAEPEFDWRIKLSIASLAELLITGIYTDCIALDIPPKPLHLPERLVRASMSEQIKNDMLLAGWCPSVIESVHSRCNTWQMLLLLSRIDQSNLRRDHTACTSAVCEYFQSNLQTYVPKHRAQECKCHNITVDSPAVQAILERGAIALLKISGTANSVEVQVIESTPESDYVAISHVWAEGMGNPHANSLPSCQLVYLRKMVDALPVLRGWRGTNRDEGPSLIWFDTLCCPIQPPEAKQLALSRMRETYYNASEVLILDAELQSFAYDHSDICEAFARLLSCAWSHRLWTLQESILALNLYFQFENESKSLEDMFHRLKLDAFCDLRSQCMSMNFYQFIWGGALRCMADQILPQQRMPSANIGSDFWTLHQLLGHRFPSVAADEALCISTLLRLPPEELVRVSDTVQARMPKMWELVARKYGGIPQHILCLDCPRLDVKGYKWAPRSLLNKNTFQPGWKTNPWKDPKLGNITQNGLLIQCPGYLISAKQSRNGFQSKALGLFWATYTRVDTFLLQGDDGVQYIISEQSESGNEEEVPSRGGDSALHRLLNSGSCGLILVRPLVNSETDYMWDGIIGRVEGSDDTSILDLAISTRVIIRNVKATRQYTTASDAAATLAQQLKEGPITIAIEKAAMDLEAVIRDLETKMRSSSGVQGGRGGIGVSINPYDMKLRITIASKGALVKRPEQDPILALLVMRYKHYCTLNEELQAKVELKAKEALESDDTLPFLVSGREASVGSFCALIQAHLYSYIGIKQNESQQWCVDG